MTTQCEVSIKLASEMASVKEKRMVNKIIEQYKLSIASDRLDLPWDKRDEGVTTSGTIVIDGVTRNWCLGEFVRYTGPSGFHGANIDKGPGPGYDGVEMFIDCSNEWRKRADAVQIYDAIVAALQERHHPDHCSCCH